VNNLTSYLKKGIKILGIACSTFDILSDKTATIFGVVFRGSELLEGVMKTTITVDGEDATEKIIEMIEKSSHKGQLKLIITRGVTIAGFNYIDMRKIFERTTLPVISVIDRKPNMNDIKKALENLPQSKKRSEAILNSGPLVEVKTSQKEEPVFIQSIGLENKIIANLLIKITKVGRIPEPIRVARLIATAEEN
jgi:endonuclease V-like protein UPF0215 family